MKHCVPNRSEPIIEVIMKMVVQWGVVGFFFFLVFFCCCCLFVFFVVFFCFCFFLGGVCVVVNVNEGSYCENSKKQLGEGGQVRVDVNEELKVL